MALRTYFHSAIGLAAALILAVPVSFLRANDEPARAAQEVAYVVVVEPPDSFASTAGQLGFLIVSRMPLGALGLTAYRVRVPSGETAETGAAILRTRFPDLIIGNDDLDDMDTTSSPRPTI